MRRKPYGLVSSIKHRKLTLEDYIPINLHRSPVVRLHPTKASPEAEPLVIHQIAWYGRHIRRSERDLEIWELSLARKSDAAFSVVHFRSLDLAPVCFDYKIIGEDESGPGVHDGWFGVRVALLLTITDGKGLGFDLPMSVGGVDRGVGEWTLELRFIDSTEFVGAEFKMPEIGREDGFVEGGHDIFEEGLHLSWLDSVQGTER